jgi:hypothetical protein
MNLKSLLVLFLAGAFIFSAFDTEAARKTRDLVFEDEESDPGQVAKDANIKNAKVVAVKTTIELTRDGQTSTVLPNHVFKSGDKVRVLFSTNIDGFVYWMSKGTSGNYMVLFPSPKTGMDNAVKKNTEYTVPTKGAFRFDDKPGKEELLCVVSAQRLPDLDKAIAEASGSAGGDVKDSSKQIAAVEDKNTSKRKTRDLVFEEEDEEDVNTKSQVATAGEPFVAYYELVHK